MKQLLATVAIVAATITTAAQAHAVTMPKELKGAWCWDGRSSEPQTYHRCEAMGGGEDFEFKAHSFEDEATIGEEGKCQLKNVQRRPNLYVLDFTCGDRLEISGNPSLDHIVIKMKP